MGSFEKSHTMAYNVVLANIIGVVMSSPISGVIYCPSAAMRYPNVLQEQDINEDDETLESEIIRLAAQADKEESFFFEDNEISESRIARLYRLSKSSGHPEERNELAIMYEEGDEVNRNDKEAARLFRLAAEEGCVNAQYHLGLMCWQGRGGTWDKEEGIRLFRLAAEGGSAEALYILGLMHEEGQGVEHDEKEAVRLYRLAADKGYAEAQCTLGFMYEDGPERRARLRRSGSILSSCRR